MVTEPAAGTISQKKTTMKWLIQNTRIGLSFNAYQPFQLCSLRLHTQAFGFRSPDFDSFREFSSQKESVALSSSKTEKAPRKKRATKLISTPVVNDLAEPNKKKIEIRVDPNGDRYEGEIHETLYKYDPHGQGVMTYIDGSKYDGAWELRRYHGTGTRTYVDGSIYTGMWNHGKRQGNGTLVGDFGDAFQPTTVKDGSPESTLTVAVRPNAGSARYDGEWFMDQRHGHGVQSYFNGAQYTGEWLEGEKHGIGIQTYPQGYKYEGQWLHGLMQG